MDIRLIIFDFDGTIGDTRRNVVVTMQQTLEELHLPERSEEACAATIGIPLEDCFRELLPDATEDVILECAATYRRIFEINKERMRPQPFPHVAETLKTLHEQGIQMTVATSRGLESVKDLLTGMGLIQYFDYLLGADSVTKHKPDPEPVLQTLRDLNADASQTLVVGDMPVDILMGARAGCKTCGVTYGNASREELQEAGADFIIDDFANILAIE
ncbi:MAG: HAD-IA family hydrolase [Prevotella sp.]|nr:HAD-IA family hydrolase [Prevotella sp.]